MIWEDSLFWNNNFTLKCYESKVNKQHPHPWSCYVVLDWVSTVYLRSLYVRTLCTTKRRCSPLTLCTPSKVVFCIISPHSMRKRKTIKIQTSNPLLLLEQSKILVTIFLFKTWQQFCSWRGSSDRWCLVYPQPLNKVGPPSPWLHFYNHLPKAYVLNMLLTVVHDFEDD